MLTSIKLTNYRNYESLKLDFNKKSTIFIGANGAGKTNILEAISLLSPGKGLKFIKDIRDINNNLLNKPWVANFNIIDKDEDDNIIGLSHLDGKRQIFINGNKNLPQTRLPEFASVIWLTPQMNDLFIGSSQNRRKFLDRLVYNFFNEHLTYINSYENVMRQRAKILQDDNQNIAKNIWLDTLEEKMAAKAIAIAVSRIETANILNKYIQNIYINNEESLFPIANINVIGNIENSLSYENSSKIEEDYKKQLLEARSLDKKSRITNFGPHRSDLKVIYDSKNICASKCSTGEQKALLVSVILAELYAKINWQNVKPILLLDDITSCLDNKRLKQLFKILQNLNIQIFMSGTDEEDFTGFEGDIICL